MLQTLTVLAFLGSAALAGDPAVPAPAAPAPAATTTAPVTPPVDCSTITVADAKVACENANALKAAQDALLALGDCSKLAADAKPACDTKAAELNAKIALLTPPPIPEKGGKATRSNTNRMEVENADE